MRLYHGTTEKIAKAIPMSGLFPYEIPHTTERVYSDPKQGTIHLTDCFAAYQAFCAANTKTEERWGLIEVVADDLELRPDPYCAGRIRSKDRWKYTLDMTGMCVCHEIPKAAVRKIWIYDPRSNWFITRIVLHSTVHPEYRRRNLERLKKLNQWLVGDYIGLDDLLGEEKRHFTAPELEKMKNQVANRNGLDLYFG